MAEQKTRKEMTPEQVAELDDLFARARAALKVIETYDQAKVDRLCQAVAWAVANTTTFHRLVEMGIEESGLGDYTSRMNKRMKIRGVLRDALRQPSVGIIEEDPEKGLVKYGKPAGIIGCIVPTTNPDLTPAGNAIYGIKARDAVIFSLPLEEALARCFALITPLPGESVPLRKAAGRVLATAATARLTQPPFDASAMDGYALGRAAQQNGLQAVVMVQVHMGRDDPVHRVARQPQRVQRRQQARHARGGAGVDKSRAATVHQQVGGVKARAVKTGVDGCLLYTSPSPRD